MAMLIRKVLRAVIRWALTAENVAHDPSDLDRDAAGR